MYNFNSHAHVERDLWIGAYNEQNDNFNSHAHVERDRKVFGKTSHASISTHTLTWSVTLSAQSKHAQPCDFNSHAHVERDAISVVRAKLRDTFQLTRSRGA